MSRASVILVEDHDTLREVTVESLSAQGHSVRGAADADELDELLMRAPADVVILDVNLPGESGWSICARLRQGSPRIGIIMLTALGAEEHRVRGYSEGADIYLAKPTSQAELAAAVTNLARRSSIGSGGGDGQLLILDEAACRVIGPLGESVLTPAEVQILRGLALAAGRQLAYWQLLELVGAHQDAHAKAALEVRITRLRMKLSAVGAPAPSIRAVRRMGYQLSAAWSVK